jgi:hypothetical protein
MIINGASYRCIWWWEHHFGDDKENVRTEIVQSQGLASDTIGGMIREMYAMSLGTEVKNFMWICDISPAPDKAVTEKDRDRFRQVIEQQRGLEGQPGFMIEQEKADGRKHYHLIKFRIDLETGKAISDSLDAKICRTASRQICEEMGWERNISPFEKDREGPRPKRAPKRYESYRAMKSGLTIKDIEAEVTEVRQESENGQDFKATLESHGYILARGDKMTAGELTLMLIDPAGDEHSLAKRLRIKTKELNEFVRDLDREALPDIRQAQQMQLDRKIAALEADRDRYN